MRDPQLGTKPKWLKDALRNVLTPLIQAIDSEWAGTDGDWAVQINVINSAKQPINRHVDEHDIAPQYGLALGDFITPFALDTTTLTLRLGRDQRGGFATIRLCAHHVTLPDRSRGATDSGLFKSEQSSNGSRVVAVTRYSNPCMEQSFGNLTAG